MNNLQNKRSHSADRLPSRSRTPGTNRIEDHLLIKHEHAKKKLMNLKEERNNQEMQQMRSKPEISKKSKQLAMKAEKRFYEQYKNMMNQEVQKLFENMQTIPAHEQNIKSKVKFEEDSKEVCLKEQPKRFIKRAPLEKPQTYTFGKEKETVKAQEQQQISVCNMNSSDKSVPSRPKCLNPDLSPKSRESGRSPFPSTPASLTNKSFFSALNTTQYSTDESQNESLFYMSAIDRNSVWEQQRQQKLQQKKEETVQQTMKKCTFTPIFYSRLPHKLHKLPAEDLLSISTRHNEDSYNTERSITRGRSLTPYTRVVGFKSGFDMDRFMKRAKPVAPLI